MRTRTLDRWLSGTNGIVAKAMGMFAGVQVIGIVCGIVRVKLIAILLGTAGVGLFSIFNNALTLLSTFTQLGMRTSAIREIASADDKPKQIYMVKMWGRGLAMLGLAVTLIASPLLSRYTFGDYGHTLLFASLAIPVALMAITSSQQAILQGMSRLRKLANANITGLIAGLIVSVPVIYYLGMGCIIPVIIAYSLAAWLATWHYRLRENTTTLRPTFNRLWEMGKPMIKLGAYMTIAASYTEAISYVFTVFLTHTGGTEAVGIYQSGYTIMTRYVGMIFSALGMEYYPRLAAACSHPYRQKIFVRHETVLLLAVVCPLLVVFMPLAPTFIRLLYSGEFVGCVPYVLLASPGIILRGYSWCISFLILARGDGRTYVMTEVIIDTVGLALNISGYLYGGMAGLGISFTLWYLFYALMITAVSSRRYHITPSRRVVLTTVLSFILTGIVAAILISLR